MFYTRTPNRNVVTYNKVQFAKGLGFLSMKHKSMNLPNSNWCMANIKKNCEPCQFSIYEQYVSVLYFEILG